MVPRDDAGDRLLLGDRVADADAHVLPRAEPAAPRVVLDLDRHRAYAEGAARLERPRELDERRAAQAAGDDPLERLALALVAALVDVEHEVPGRARLVVAVAEREHGGEAAEVDVAGVPAAGRPRKRAFAHAVGG